MATRYTGQQRVDPVSTLLFVGRQRELTQIWKHYYAACDGQVNVVLVSGEPGIGKTRLLDEVMALAANDGASVSQGGASEAEGMPPYLPFLEALIRHIQVCPLDQLREQIASVPPVLATLLPELVTRLGDLPISQPLPPEQTRFRLFEAIGMFLKVIGEPRVLVITLDDLHWADTASLDLLNHLARHQLKMQLLILGAYRECEIDQNPALARTITELARQRVLTLITLGPLSVAEIGILAERKLGGSLQPAVRALLHKHSEGNPFFAEEILDGWIEEGNLVYEQNQWVAIAPLDHTLPPSIVGALRQRFTRLSAQSIDLLRVAAIIGRTFDLSLLATVQGQEIETVEDRLLEATQIQLVRTDQSGRFLFSHDKIRECLYAEVSTSRCRRLHGLIGYVLEKRYEHGKIVNMHQLAELAFHFTRSEDQERGVTYSQLAAAEAFRTFATEEAISHYRIALGLLRLDDKRRSSLLLGLGDATLLAGHENEAEIAYKEAQDWLSQEGDPKAFARATHGVGRAQWRQNKRVEACASFKRALALIGDRCCREGVEVLADLSILFAVDMGQQDKGISYAQQALEMAQTLGDAGLELMTRRIIAGNLSLQGGDLAAAVQFLEQVLQDTEARGDLTEAMECSLNLTAASYWLALMECSREASYHLVALSERCRQPYQLRVAYTWLALLHTSQGRWTDAAKMIEQGYLVADHLLSTVLPTFLHQVHGFLAYQREDFVLAERELQIAMTLAEQDRQMSLGMIMFYFGLLGLVQATMGRREEAYAHITKVEARLDLFPKGILPTAPLIMCLVLTALMLDDQERALRLYPRLQTFRGQYYWFLVDRVLGIIATRLGEWEAAEGYLNAAEGIARREGLQPELARTFLARASLELAQSGQENTHAKDLLKQALNLFKELGMAHSVRNVIDQLRALTSQPGVPASLPARLTQREAEVLKIVVQGKSNRQIALALGLSEKTVTNYLTHIFNKTDCENRAAATAFAIRHGLA